MAIHIYAYIYTYTHAIAQRASFLAPDRRAHSPDVVVIRMNLSEGSLLPAALEATIVTSYHRLGTRLEISMVASVALESREEFTPHTLLRELAWSRQREMV